MLKYFLGLFLLSTCVIAFSTRALLGSKECSWGPSYWCKNLSNAKNCNAVKHCIQTVWQHQKPTVDEEDDDICSLCKAMVTDARNVLESNETLENIKDVFQRSCELIMLKPIVKQCIKFADEYAEELVEMLGSYMSPDIICTLAGLCSSAEIGNMHGDVHNKKMRDKERNAELQKDCEPCMDLAEYIDREIQLATPDDVKQYFKEKCNYFGSLTLACTNTVDEFIPEMYKRIAADYTPESLCYLTSACVNGYGRRRVQVKTKSDLGVIHVNKDAISVAVKHLSNDQTCELCKTMVTRLKDVLVSNTTQAEFKQMLIGICKQTGRFQAECYSLTREYYDKVYQYLANDFNATEACLFIGLCDFPDEYYNSQINPFLPRPAEEEKTGSVSVAKSDTGVRVFTPISSHTPVKVEISYGDPLESKYQLPLERMAIPQEHDLNVNNRESCTFCQYLLHYLQKVISQPYGENALKEAVDKVCDLLPHSITLQCRNFVDEFGDAFVAILAQEIDPSQVCPALRVCPARILGDKFDALEVDGAPGCPLCLMVVEDIAEKLKDNKTEDAIRKALHNLCDRMTNNLRPQCNEFVQKYTEEVVDMMLADFTPQEVCTFLKLCHTKVDVELVAPYPEEKSEVLTNEISREDAALEEVEEVDKKKNQPLCFLCEFVMDKVKDQLRNNETEEEVRRIVSGACSSIPKAIESDCHDFVNKYSKYIVEMLENNVDPRMVCQEMHMCKEQEESTHMDRVFVAVEECAICEALVGAIRGLLEDKTFDRNMSRYAVQICYSIPFLKPVQMDRCRSMVLSYGPSIINLMVELGVRPELVCSRLELCDDTEQTKVELIESSTEVPESHPQQRPHLLGGNSCTWGPSYWCQSEDHAKECGTLAHCREVVWKADRPTPAA